MPEICRFHGIIIRMFAEAGGPHHHPHFHAYFGGASAVVGLQPIEVIAGELPRTQQRLVLAWAELHSGELRSDWDRLLRGERPLPIDPLA